MATLRDPLLDSIRDAYGRVVYTHKTHEKQADRLASWNKGLKVAELVLLVLTTGGTIGALVTHEMSARIAATVLASLALLVTLYQFRFSPDERILAHRTCARKLWLIRERYIALIADIVCKSLSAEEARSARDSLIAEVHHVYESAPDTDSRAYADAQQALKVSEELTFTDFEIDGLLPPSLRKVPPAP